jgi:hypothetical protein
VVGAAAVAAAAAPERALWLLEAEAELLALVLERGDVAPQALDLAVLGIAGRAGRGRVAGCPLACHGIP